MTINKNLFIFAFTLAVFLLLSVFFPLYVSGAVAAGAWLTAGTLTGLNNIVRKDARLPDVFADKRRNFKYLLLGSTRVWRAVQAGDYNNDIDNRLYSFAYYKRSLNADFLILKRMFSYVRESGFVVITVDFKAQPRESGKLQYADLCLLHEVTLNILGMRFGKYQKAFPLLFHPRFSLGYLLQKTMIKQIRQKWRSRYAWVNKPEYYFSALSEMVEFCRIRELQPKVVFIIDDEHVEAVADQVKEMLQSTHHNLPVYTIDAAEEFKKIMA